jgi:hypothetical protein
MHTLLKNQFLFLERDGKVGASYLQDISSWVGSDRFYRFFENCLWLIYEKSS